MSTEVGWIPTCFAPFILASTVPRRLPWPQNSGEAFGIVQFSGVQTSSRELLPGAGPRDRVVVVGEGGNTIPLVSVLNIRWVVGWKRFLLLNMDTGRFSNFISIKSNLIVSYSKLQFRMSEYIINE